jgi:CBS domain-containing protein
VVAAKPEPARACVQDVMSSDLIVIDISARVEEAMAIMTERRCRHLPVMESGRVVGLVPIGDLTRRVRLGQAFEIQRLVDYVTGRTEPRNERGFASRPRRGARGRRRRRR